MNIEQVPFLGLRFDNVNLGEALDKIELFIAERTPRKFFTPNVAILIWSRKDPFLRGFYNSCDMVTVDGMAIYYALKLLGTPLKDSVSASLIFYPLLEMSQKKGYKIYFVGAQKDILETAVSNLKKQYPGINICGHHHGYFDMENPPTELISDIKEKKPDLIFLGMSTPYKEKFTEANMKNLGVPVSLGVGGMFDIAAGAVTFAPNWIRKLALEWLYRLLQEPRRMWRRYLTTNTEFLWLFFKELINRRILRKAKTRSM